MAKRSSSSGGGKGKSGGGHYRSAITGRYVPASYGKSHPKTTVQESSWPGTLCSNEPPPPEPRPKGGGSLRGSDVSPLAPPGLVVVIQSSRQN